MYLTVKKEQIIEGLQKAASIIPSKAGAAYLRSIWLQAVKTPDGDRLTIMSTDVNIEFTGTYPADIKEEGTAGVNGRAFVELLRRLPGGDISLRLDEESHILSVEQGRRSYKLPTVDPVWFQPLPPFPEEGSVLWSGDFFQDIIDRVAFCISDDDSAEGLACLYLKAGEAGKVDVCGLNGHQFAMVRFINDELARLLPENGLLIQKKYVNELRKWLGSDEVMLNISERRFHIRTGSGSETLSIPRSANFSYPDHLSFLARLDGDNTSQLDVDRRETLNALDRLLIFNNDSDRCTYFRFSPQEVELSAQPHGHTRPLPVLLAALRVHRSGGPLRHHRLRGRRIHRHSHAHEDCRILVLHRRGITRLLQGKTRTGTVRAVSAAGTYGPVFRFRAFSSLSAPI